MTENKRSTNWLSVILGVLFFIVAFIAFKNPVTTLSSLVIYFGAIAIVKGVMGLLSVSKIKKLSTISITPLLVISILDIILGLIIMFNFKITFLSLPYLFGIWFILDAMQDLIYGKYLKGFGNGLYGMNIFTSILNIILGVLMIFNPLSAYVTIVYLIGINFIIWGTKYLIRGFMGK